MDDCVDEDDNWCPVQDAEPVEESDESDSEERSDVEMMDGDDRPVDGNCSDEDEPIGAARRGRPRCIDSDGNFINSNQRRRLDLEDNNENPCWRNDMPIDGDKYLEEYEVEYAKGKWAQWSVEEPTEEERKSYQMPSAAPEQLPLSDYAKDQLDKVKDPVKYIDEIITGPVLEKILYYTNRYGAADHDRMGEEYLASCDENGKSAKREPPKWIWGFINPLARFRIKSERGIPLSLVPAFAKINTL